MELVLEVERFEAALGGGRNEFGPIPTEVTHLLDCWAGDDPRYGDPIHRQVIRCLLPEIDAGRIDDDLPAPPPGAMEDP